MKDDMAASIYIPDGTVCDDGNQNTINDIYTNGTCSGIRNFDFNVIWENYKGNINIVYLNPSDGSVPYTFGVRIQGSPVVQTTGISVQELKNYGYSEVSFIVSSSSNGVVGYCYNGDLIAYEYGRNLTVLDMGPLNITLT